MRQSVWVIEQGEYSDYRVVGVYSSRENAERIAARINGAGPMYKATVAEWPLDPGIDALNQGLHLYCVTMSRDGAVENVVSHDSAWEYGDLGEDVFIWRRSRAPAYWFENGSDALVARVWARDEKHAVKIANEKRVRMIASGAWTDVTDSDTDHDAGDGAT